MRLLFITLFMAVLIFPGAASPVDVQRDQSMFRGFGSRSDGTDGEKRQSSISPKFLMKC
jgi:hypothetical protein